MNDSREFEMTCSQTLSKNVTVTSIDYTPVIEKEYDGEGVVTECHYDTSNINWEEEYHDNDHYTPLQLIELFGKHLQDELEGTQNIKKSRPFLKYLMEECSNWIEDECEYLEN